jgi:hypothetical protein
MMINTRRRDGMRYMMLMMMHMMTVTMGELMLMVEMRMGVVVMMMMMIGRKGVLSVAFHFIFPIFFCGTVQRHRCTCILQRTVRLAVLLDDDTETVPYQIPEPAGT